MPVLLPVNSVVTVRHEYEMALNVAYNVLHYRLNSATVVSSGLPLATDPIADLVLPTLAATAGQQWSLIWSGIASGEINYTGCTAQKVFAGDRSVPYTWTPAAPIPGLVEDEALPLQDTITILKQTGYGQRWGMGRVFVPGLAESAQEAGLVTPAYVTALADLVNLVSSQIVFTTGGISYAFIPVVTNVPSGVPSRITVVSSSKLSNRLVKSQKRRRPGKGI